MLNNDDFDERMVLVVDSLEDTVSEEDIFHLSSIWTGPNYLEKKCESNFVFNVNSLRSEAQLIHWTHSAQHSSDNLESS